MRDFPDRYLATLEDLIPMRLDVLVLATKYFASKVPTLENVDFYFHMGFGGVFKQLSMVVKRKENGKIKVVGKGLQASLINRELLPWACELDEELGAKSGDSVLS